MVGRLVEQQRVRRTQQHARDGEARALAARQHAHRLVDVVAREEEAAEDVADRRHHVRAASPTPASRRPSAPDPAASLRPARNTASRRCGLRRARRVSGASSPDSIRISVDLPTPFGPTSAMRSPRSMCRLDVARSTRDVAVAPCARASARSPSARSSRTPES